MVYIFFIYGLSFFALWLVLFIYPKKESRFSIAQNLWLLALFGLFHGAHDWTEMFEIIFSRQIGFDIFKIVILPLSFLFLFQFGINNLERLKQKNHSLKFLPGAMVIIWLLITMISGDIFRNGEIFARYLLGTSGSVLTCYALYLHYPEIRQTGQSRVIRNLKLLIGAFAVYGLFTSLIVPEGNFFPASVLNYRTFREFTGFPIQLLRAIAVFLIAYSMTQVLRIFQWETFQRMREAHEELERKVKERTAQLESEMAVREKAEEAVRGSLREKETLLRELYHRTKNNMQVISGLINLQVSSIMDPAIIQMFKDTQNRIQAMSLVHEKFYQSKDLSNVNLKDYIEELADSLRLSYLQNPERVSLEFDIENIRLPLEFVTPCGLIINELMSNSLKYAFPDDRRGEITISLHFEDHSGIELDFKDNGVGLPADFNYDLSRIKTLGLMLVYNLAIKQLHGSLYMKSNGGTEFIIKCKRAAK